MRVRPIARVWKRSVAAGSSRLCPFPQLSSTRALEVPRRSARALACTHCGPSPGLSRTRALAIPRTSALVCTDAQGSNHGTALFIDRERGAARELDDAAAALARGAR